MEMAIMTGLTFYFDIVATKNYYNGKVCIRAKWSIRPELILVSAA